MNNLKKLLRAASFAAKKHTGQHRKGEAAEPYINHPLEVVNLIANVGGVEETDILTAALLHDTVEDCGITRDEIAEMFGERVAGYVMEVTDDKSLPKAERKRLQVVHAPNLSRGAKIIKLGDKISNISDITNSPPAGWSVHRRLEYIDWGVAVVDGLRGVNEPLEAYFDSLTAKARKAVADES